MKYISILLLCTTLIMNACTNESDARRVLEEQGYTEIHFTGYDMFGCSEDDTYRTGFTATSPTGHRVSGVVCGGYMKLFQITNSTTSY